jgi:hypothetical protein
LDFDDGFIGSCGLYFSLLRIIPMSKEDIIGDKRKQENNAYPTTLDGTPWFCILRLAIDLLEIAEATLLVDLRTNPLNI